MSLPSQQAGTARNLFYYVYNTPYGAVTIQSNGSALTKISLGAQSLEGDFKPHQAANQAATQILEYLAGKRHGFSLQLAPAGSTFQQQVWDKLRAIPYGQTSTCAKVAESLGKPGSHKAVGTAVRGNPLAIVIPAHRIVDNAGRPLDTGKSAQLKSALLRLEQQNLAAEES